MTLSPPRTTKELLGRRGLRNSAFEETTSNTSSRTGGPDTGSSATDSWASTRITGRGLSGTRRGSGGSAGTKKTRSHRGSSISSPCLVSMPRRRCSPIRERWRYGESTGRPSKCSRSAETARVPPNRLWRNGQSCGRSWRRRWRRMLQKRPTTKTTTPCGTWTTTMTLSTRRWRTHRSPEGSDGGWGRCELHGLYELLSSPIMTYCFMNTPCIVASS
ncbi:hypothetical protein OH77DRAFT_1077398 [Trametes cingulata]|nr:hypothetical protein OH77DRAFT_1077398 [Trametes cingulata]